MKLNNETDAAYIVRTLRDSYDAARRREDEARFKSEAAFDALNLAERAQDYLEGLAKKRGF